MKPWALMTDDNLLQITENLLDWMEKEDFTSFDPYDIWSSKIGLWLERNNKNYLVLPLRKSMSLFERYFPVISRTFVKRTKSSTAVALCASSYLLLYQLKKDPMLLEKAKNLLGWLEKNSSKGYSGFCWGLPFDWQFPDNILAEKSTPCSTIIIYMVDAFLLGYKITKEEKYLKIAVSTANFFMNDLNKDITNENCICLGYTPLDRFHITNVNSYAAATLYTVYNHTKNKILIDCADKFINYVIKEQNSDGSWYYWGSQQRKNKVIDSLHQCYIIENLYRCYLINKNTAIHNSIEKALDFYMKNFIIEGKITKLPISEKRTKPIELIDLAEAIYMFTLLKSTFNVEDMLTETLEYALKNFKINNKPFFYSYIIKNHRMDIPYMRWGQSQLLYSVVLYLIVKSNIMRVEDILI